MPAQAMLELAIILPVLLLMGLSMTDLGRVFYYQEAVANAAREGANYGSAYPTATPSQISAAASSEAGGIAPLTISPLRGYDTTRGKWVRVEVSYEFGTVTPLVQRLTGSTLQIKASCTMPVSIGTGT